MAWSKCACRVCVVLVPPFVACGGRSGLHKSPFGTTLGTGGTQQASGQGGTLGGSFPVGGMIGTAGNGIAGSLSGVAGAGELIAG
jgi:hypothetical protein